MAPTVSVLVTVYNRASYLGACLESILCSTFDNFEVIVVDDASDDESVEVAVRIARRDDRIRLVRNDQNLGDYPNRNAAASHASGQFLKYVDADDVLYPHSLGIMVSAMEAFPDAALGLSWNVLDPPHPYPFVHSPEQTYRAHFLGRSPLGVGPSAAIIRRDAFETVGGFSGEQFLGDTDLWLRLGARWPVVSLAPALVWWRRHEGQQMVHEMARADVLDRRFKANMRHLRAASVLTTPERAHGERRLRRNHARRLWSIALRQRRPLVAIDLLRSSGLGLKDLARGLLSYA